MKKTNLLIFLLVISLHLVAQEKYLSIFPLKDSKVTYSAVLQTSGISKYELYNKARIWLATNCETIKLDDEDIVVGEGVFAFKFNEFFGGYEYFHIRCIIAIQFKEEQYKYTFSDFRLNYVKFSQGTSDIVDDPIEDLSIFKDHNKRIDLKIKELIVSLDQVMKRTIDDNW